ncbi:NAD(P)H-dependent flavin oxidoreductase [Alkalicoccus urumqiensis]|uniref:Probable nitronate monooxygenase n=1 Tax=Alkalicoccus urumqiensis TaxID=1548213 RepID=A0A2P6MJ91_ALKUR|nr:nitronate monooxygenase [Alkalicoccus urumqiensis]PRO66354.1 nitronate monooxygenase [Alkalicoccus urumqiensis]
MTINHPFSSLELPIIQAPMAGGITTPQMVIETGRHGGLGMLAAGYLTPENALEQIREVKQALDKPFGINLFVPQPFHVDEADVQKAEAALAPFSEALDLSGTATPPLPVYEKAVETFQAHIDVILEERVPVCSFTFGLPDAAATRRLKENGVFLIGTATTTAEAVLVEESGMDMVVVQGSEAGGHRGHFHKSMEESHIGLFSLIPQTVDAVTIPVAAAGGIMDARGIQAARCLGAAAVQMGTAFLPCQESGAPDAHKNAVLQAQEDDVVMTRAFSGKWARGIQNEFIQMMKDEDAVVDFPVQNALTKPIRSAAGSRGDTAYMSLWTGQSTRLARRRTVKELMESLAEELKPF